jgi:hypothetical protein
MIQECLQQSYPLVARGSQKINHITKAKMAKIDKSEKINTSDNIKNADEAIDLILKLMVPSLRAISHLFLQ